MLLSTEQPLCDFRGSNGTFGGWLDSAWFLNLGLAAFGIFAIVMELKRSHGSIDLNLVIMTLVFVGIVVSTYWPGRKTKIEQQGRIPFEDDV